MYPLYTNVRRRGSSEDAQDLTQAFFVRLFERDSLARADKHRGRFRSFLLSSLKHFLINEWAKAQAVPSVAAELNSPSTQTGLRNGMAPNR